MRKFKESDIICPYFKALEDKYIKCEGFSEHSELIQRFSQRKEYQDWLNTFCLMGHYKHCPVAGLLHRYYDGILEADEKD